MSAFNDYCIVCDKLCTTHSVYCSEKCKIRDSESHYNFRNVPQLISPVLHSRNDSTATIESSLDTEELDDDENDDEAHQEYLIKSPLLLSTNLKEHSSIAGFNLNDSIPRDQSAFHSAALDQHHNELLAASSNNYKKWLNVVL